MFDGALTAAGGHGPLAIGSQAHLFNIASHAVVGCLSSAASGGSCKSGAFAAAAGAAATPLVGKVFIDPKNNVGDMIGGTTSTGVIGGLASVAGGGKFENGAVTAAFGYMFNYLACDRGKCYGDNITREEIDAHYRDRTGWPVYAGSMDPSWLDSPQFDAISVGSSGLIKMNWPLEALLDVLKPWRSYGDRNIYGDFTATQVDADHFLWSDTYNFNIQPGFSVRNAATMWGDLVAGQGQGGVGFQIIGIKPVRIPR